MAIPDILQPGDRGNYPAAEIHTINVESFGPLEELVAEVYVPADDELLAFMQRAHEASVNPPGSVSLGATSLEHQLFRYPRASLALGRRILGYYNDPAMRAPLVPATDIVGNMLILKRGVVTDPSREFPEYWARLSHKAIIHDIAHAKRDHDDVVRLHLDGDRLDALHHADAILSHSLYEHDRPLYRNA